VREMTWKQWLHGLAAALVGGVTPFGTVGMAGIARGYVLDWNFWEPIIYAAVFNAWVVFEAYRRQFPPPGTLTSGAVVKDAVDSGSAHQS
jgi:hypothetical protein